MNGINLLVDSTPLLSSGAGIKSYLYYWSKALEASRGKNQLSRFPWLPNTRTFQTDHSLVGPWMTKANLILLHYGVNKAGSPIVNLLARHADIFHISSHTRAAPKRPKLTATIYDLTCWLTPELHEGANVEATRAFGERFWPHAAALIAISHSAKDDAVYTLGLRPERIHVIYPGVAPQFFDPPAHLVRRVQLKYSLNRPYFLFVGTIEPRKNLPLLLSAWTAIPESRREGLELVIVGPFGWESPGVRARLSDPPKRVRYLGHLPEEDLPGLTAGALALVYPSLYEGFGFPIAQAMAAGVPVVTSNNSSMIEISEGCALHFDPRSESEISSSLTRIIEDPEIRASLGREGRLRAERFRWETSAKSSWQLFERIAGKD